jgi:hypothetical protein
MSRSCYTDCDDSGYPMALWRGAVASSIRGKRGQALLKELVASLDAIPNKRLIAHELVKDGECCALGAVAMARGQDVSWVDPEAYEVVAKQFNIAEPLAREIEYENDEGFWSGIETETPEHRWARMRAWAVENIRSPASGEVKHE